MWGIARSRTKHSRVKRRDPSHSLLFCLVQLHFGAHSFRRAKKARSKAVSTPNIDPHVFSMLVASIPAKNNRENMASLSRTSDWNTRRCRGVTSVTHLDKKMLRHIKVKKFHWCLPRVLYKIADSGKWHSSIKIWEIFSRWFDVSLFFTSFWSWFSLILSRDERAANQHHSLTLASW